MRDFSDIRERVSAVTQLDYLVGCHFEQATQQLLVLGGSYGCALSSSSVSVSLSLSAHAHTRAT